MDYAEIWAEAWTAGLMAGLACRPHPMYVLENGKIIEAVLDGCCGFAWVKIRPANSKMARWLKSQDLGHKGYNGGRDVSIYDFGQSLERKSAAAQAAAMILRKHGIDATSHNRID